MLKNINEIEFVIFDTETTGLDPARGDRIVEIAGVRIKGNQRISIFQSLVNPGRRISEAAFAVNKISQEMLDQAPRAEEVIPKFMDFAKGACLCSYNAGFDVEFLNNELKVIGLSPLDDAVIIDALKMSRRLVPGLERYALWFVAQALGIENKQEHRAFSDVEMTLQLFYKLQDVLMAKGIADFSAFSNLFGLKSKQLDDVNNQRIAEIQQAIDLGLRLKIKYISGASATISEREVIPKEIKQEYNHSYLIGYCCLKRDERTFRIDGILHLETI